MKQDNHEAARFTRLQYFETGLKVLECVAVAAGVVIAFYALREYRKANTEYRKASVVSMFSKLSDQNSRIYDRLYLNDSLNSFWATLPEGLSIREKADMKLMLVLTRQTEDKEISQKPLLQWKHVRDLDDVVWARDTFGNPMYRQLRDAYNFAEEILNMEASSYFARQQGLMTEEEADTYSTLIEDIGEHPLYLAAVSWNHDNGGITKQFAQYLKEKYVKNSDLKAVALAIYPEMINDPKWINTTGTRN